MPADRTLRIVIVIAAVIGLAALLCGGLWLWKARYDTAVITTYVADGNAKAQADMGLANSIAEVEGNADDAVVVSQREELRNAETPPAVPDGLSDRQRRGCIILRQQGQDLARYPACRALAGRP